MIKSIRIAPSNSLLFISDPNGGEAPDPVRGALVLSTPSCISVACLMWQDGETEVSLGSDVGVHENWIVAFDGMLETPNRSVVVSTVEGNAVLEAHVPGTRTRVRIWLNRLSEPDRVAIELQ